MFDSEPMIGSYSLTDTLAADIMAHRSVKSSVCDNRVRDCLTDPVLRLLRVDTRAIVA